MTRSTCYPVNLRILQIVYQRRLPIHNSCTIPLLTMIVVAPSVHLARVGDCQTVQRTHGYVNHFLATQAFDQGRSANVVIVAVTKAEVVALSPGPDLAVLGQRERELGATLDLHDSEAVQTVDEERAVAAVAAASPEFAWVVQNKRVIFCSYSSNIIFCKKNSLSTCHTSVVILEK